MLTSTLTEKGDLMLPKEVQEHLGLQPGNKIAFDIEADGTVRLRALKHDISSLRGLLKNKTGKTITVEDMNRAIRERAAENYRKR